jgi:hypothetical protein
MKESWRFSAFPVTEQAEHNFAIYTHLCDKVFQVIQALCSKTCRKHLVQKTSHKKEKVFYINVFNFQRTQFSQNRYFCTLIHIGEMYGVRSSKLNLAPRLFVAVT